MRRVFRWWTRKHDPSSIMAKLKIKTGRAQQKNFCTNQHWQDGLFCFYYRLAPLGYGCLTFWSIWTHYLHPQASWLYYWEYLQLLLFTSSCRLYMDGCLKGGNSWLHWLGQPTTLDYTLATQMHTLWLWWPHSIPTPCSCSHFMYCDNKWTWNSMHNTIQ